jgi:hypothetical protein
MRRGILLAACTSALLSQSAPPVRAPILVELFTSEGCSSCPPADRILEQLDSRVVVLSEHVDYWDHQGWKDPFSSHQNTMRQEAYGQRFSLESVYTPQMIVDGAAEFTGSDARRATEELNRASRRKKADLRLTRTDGGLKVEIANSPGSAAVFLALAEDSGTSHVGGGENRGRELHHVAILRNLRKAGAVKRGGGFSQILSLPPEAAHQRVIVFLQEGSAGPVLGAAELGPSR